MIIKVKGRFVIYSKKGDMIGSFRTLAQAKKRLKQIEYFKNKR